MSYEIAKALQIAYEADNEIEIVMTNGVRHVCFVWDIAWGRGLVTIDFPADTRDVDCTETISIGQIEKIIFEGNEHA